MSHWLGKQVLGKANLTLFSIPVCENISKNNIQESKEFYITLSMFAGDSCLILRNKQRRGREDSNTHDLKSQIIPKSPSSNFNLILLSLLSELLRNNQGDMFKLLLICFLSLTPG